jgi:hypothetical protein
MVALFPLPTSSLQFKTRRDGQTLAQVTLTARKKEYSAEGNWERLLREVISQKGSGVKKYVIK